MTELLRLVMMRPAATTPDPPVAISPSGALSAALAAAVAQPDVVGARQAAVAQWRAAAAPVSAPADLRYGDAMHSLGERLDGPKTADEVIDQAGDLLGLDPVPIVGQEDYLSDKGRLDDSLVAVKLTSDPRGMDVNACITARRGYAALDLAVSGQNVPFPLSLAFPSTFVQSVPLPVPGVVQQPPDDPRPALTQRLVQVDQTIDTLVRVTRTAYATPAPAGPEVEVAPPAAPAGGAAEAPAAAERAAGDAAAPDPGVSIPGGATTSRWLLPTHVVATLPEAASNLAASVGGPLEVTPVTTLTSRLSDERASVLQQLAKLDLQGDRPVSRLGAFFYPPDPDAWVPTDPKDELPTTHGSVHPVGVGDLLVVREHVKAYEPGEVAHIENILRSEKMDRRTRRLERDEQQVTQETDTQKEEERDTQSTDRFSLQRETSDTVKTDAQVKAGLSVDAKYGTFVEVKADLQGSYQQVTEQSAKQATTFSQDVVTRSVSKLTQTSRQVTVTTTIREFEENYDHGFDNSNPGGGNISGVYQWVDRVSQAQIYNYGKRMLFDVIVPEPSAFYIWAQQHGNAEGSQLEKPQPLTITPGDLSEGNYLLYAQTYGATGIDPPPPLYRTYSQAWDATVAADPHLFNKSGTLVVDDGYGVISAAFAASWWYPSDKSPSVVALAGTLALNPGDTVALSWEQNSLPVGISAGNINSVTATLELLAERTDRAWAVWQEKAYAAIQQAYVARLTDYQRALAEAQAAAGVAVTGRNPGVNHEVILAELRKGCIAEVTAQQFDAFGALSTDAAGRPQLNLYRTAQQGKYVRFFEQAFEWEHLVYFFYPYFWADKQTWAHRALFDDQDDPDFAAFLRAGAARVVFPVRPGFEKAVLHFLETGLTWDGGDPPDISSSEYVNIVNEIQESEQAPGSEVAVGDAWEVRLPTSLVKLRNDDQLPRWQENDDGTWAEAN